jgi:anti-sigma regulatory factor (Ser/Thr protein kinase)
MTKAFVTFEADPSAPGVARSLLCDFLGTEVSRTLAQAAVLGTNELVTNSVKHCESDPTNLIGMALDLDTKRLRVTVFDTDGSDPAFRDDESRWRMTLVDSVADRWGVQAAAPSSAWFEVDR